MGRRRFIYGLVIWALASTSIGTYAQVNICQSSNWSHTYSGGTREFKVSLVDDDDLDGVSSTEFRRAAIAASEIWNEHSNHGSFSYTGATPLSDIPMNKSDCDADGVSHSIVVVGQDGVVVGGAAAHAQGRCFENGRATQFYIRVFRRSTPSHPNLIAWDTGSIASGRKSLVDTLLHEFGHTLNLGHIQDAMGNIAYGAIMGKPQTGFHARTSPFYWDYRCLRDNGNEHRTGKAAVHQVANGVVGSEQGITSSWNFAKISSGYTVENGMSSPSLVFKKKSSSDTWTWTRGIGWTNSDNISSISNYDGAGASDFVVKEHDEDRQILLNLPRHGYPSNYDRYEKHSPRWVISSNEFNSEVYSDMRHCTHFAGFMNCIASEKVYAGLPVSVAHHDTLDATVFAWVNQTRDGSSDDHEIFVAAGRAADGVVGKKFASGVKSLVQPGIACKNNDAAGYDCVVVYVDINSSSYAVMVKRLYILSGVSHYNVYFNSLAFAVGSGVRSANRVAAFHHDGDWWVAVKRMEYGNDIYLYTSSNGSSWTHKTTIATDAITGPSAVGWRTTDNLISYVKR